MSAYCEDAAMRTLDWARYVIFASSACSASVARFRMGPAGRRPSRRWCNGMDLAKSAASPPSTERFMVSFLRKRYDEAQTTQSYGAGTSFSRTRSIKVNEGVMPDKVSNSTRVH